MKSDDTTKLKLLERQQADLRRCVADLIDFVVELRADVKQLYKILPKKEE